MPTESLFALRTPIRIGAVGLVVRDLERCVRFYRDLIGLTVLERAGPTARLGAGSVPLLELRARPDAMPDDPSAAGLFHTAFLMPSREDLARWLVHVAHVPYPLDGASDHLVSEAIYLSDPEGNGVEVYSDRPEGNWKWSGDQVEMSTLPLDLDGLVRTVERDAAPWPGAPSGLRIGHIHLRVGDLAAAEAFYRGAIGLDLVRRYPGALFLSSGRYHHHVGANVWRSARAGPRDPGRAGLDWFEFVANDPRAFEAVAAGLRERQVPMNAAAAGFEVLDPWGTKVRVATAARPA